NSEIEKLRENEKLIVGAEDGSYFVHQSKISVLPYDQQKSAILILNKDQSLQEISQSPLQILAKNLVDPIEKYHLCYLAVKKKSSTQDVIYPKFIFLHTMEFSALEIASVLQGEIV